jgi:ribosome-associated heat shock protein Hsp15
MTIDDEDREAADGTQRLDKWLWFTRLVKSRTQAAGLVTEGKVRLNRQRVEKPSQAVHIGDVVTATVHRRVFVAKVLGLGARRGPATEARLLYEELTPPPQPASLPGREGDEAPSSRPDKRERRQLAALRRQED